MMLTLFLSVAALFLVYAGTDSSVAGMAADNRGCAMLSRSAARLILRISPTTTTNCLYEAISIKVVTE
jgi:hypothetical protein